MIRNTLLSITALTVVFIVAACGSSSESGQVQTTQLAAPIVPVAPAPVAVVPAQSPAVEVKIGNSVGDHVPEFEFSLADGTKVSSVSLIEKGEPAYLFFFAAWCPTCRSELRRLKEIWPDYADEVSFYAINIDPTDNFEDIEAYREQQGYPWPVAQPGAGMLARFKVTSQSTKIAIGTDGVITYRDRYGKGSDETWHEVFQELANQ